MTRMDRIEIDPEQLALIADHAVADLPRECCGVLVGHFDTGRTVVETVVAEVVGYYHSHPGGQAVPSRRDRALAWPQATYLIVATADGAMRERRGWRLGSGGRFEEQPMHVRGHELSTAPTGGEASA